MALTYHDARELLAARAAGAPFRRVLTVGRQALSLHPADVARLAAEHGVDPAAAWATRPPGGPADAFLRDALGAEDVTALDVSAYEGAGLLHDLNVPVPAAWEERFDAVIDGGSLEHVFDVRTALSNIMRLTRRGGRVLISVPANNLFGHGFYQFSPELFFRVFSPERGFRIERVVVAEARYPGIDLTPARAAYGVVDPDAVSERVGLLTRRPAMLVVHAEKLAHHEDPLAVAPQQSDYRARWTAGRPHHAAPVSGHVPPVVRRHLRGLRQRRRFSLRNRRFFRPLGAGRGAARRRFGR